jgi:predicted DNA-binding transcriptional regulator AlpA
MELLTEQQTAELLGVAPGTLTDWRGSERGPRYIKVGHLVRYRRSDVEQWLTERTIDPARKHGSWRPKLPPTSPTHALPPAGKGSSRLGGHKTMAERRGEYRGRIIPGNSDEPQPSGRKFGRYKTMADRRAEKQAEADTLASQQKPNGG